MKNIPVLLFFILVMSGFSVAQSRTPEFDKVKEIKLLESTREDVKKILAGYEHDDSDDGDYEQYFSSENAEIEVTFSKGDCSDDSAYWNVSEWTAVKIKVTPENITGVKDFNFSSFKKEIKDEESPEFYIYHDEKAGIAFEIGEDEIQKIILYPPESNSGSLCANESTLEISSKQKRFVDLMLEESSACVMRFANVDNLVLSTEEIKIGISDKAKNKNHSNSQTKISITTEASDPENDVLTYNYIVSAGKIIGQGAKVVWDLSNVVSGTYTIMAGVDDGCGFCGQTKTKEVIVKECQDCSKNQKAASPRKP